jgi:diguanylate cyclase (GGDEF)-like protein
MPIPGGRSSFRFLIAVAAGLTCTAALAIALTIWWLRSDAISQAATNTGNLATLLAEQSNHAVKSIDLVLSEVKRELESHAAENPDDFNRLLRSENIYQLLVERLSHLSQADRMFLANKDGRVANTTIRFPASEIDISDREYFQHFKSNKDKNLYINQILTDRRAGTRIVLFSKRIDGANGEFLGVILVGVRYTYFQHIYQSIKSIHDQSFLFLHRDGTVIVRYPESSTRAGMRMPAGSPWHRLVSEGGGYYRSPGYFDNEPRLVAVRPVPGYPLVVNVALSEAAAFATWRSQAITLGIGTLLVMFSSAFLLAALSKQFRRLATSETTLQQANAKVDAALNNMSQGLVMFDSSNRLVVCNQRYLEMYGLSQEVVKPGCTLRELLNYRVATGNFFSDDPEQYMQAILAAASEGVSLSKVTCLNDGRIISIVNTPTADGGWVATHEDVTEKKRAEERVTYAAHNDALTGLPNRKLFCEQLEQALKRVRRGERLAVLYLDLDHLKRVNDTLGHPVGDKLLKSVADRLRGCVREIDLVARLSGDEFAIIQTSLNHPSDAATLALRAREAIHEPFDLDGHQVTVDVSVGISIAPNDATELNELLRTADIALYEAKNFGRGTYCFYEPEMNARMQVRGQLEHDLQSALANGEFELHYQPVVSLDDDKIVSFEALLRWHHPTRGLVSPAEFIPVAEEMGLIVPLGEWVLRTACVEAATWPDDIRVAVNVSPIQLSNKNLLNVIVGAVASAGIQPDKIEIEITESVFIKNTFANLAMLKNLHEFGVQFSMDDFGTGYSSLGYLLSFPFSKIKVDRSFIAGLPDRPESRAIVRAIADLARSLGMRVTAEGVETAEQLGQVRALGCTEAQGYLFSQPLTAAEIHRQFLAGRRDTASVTSHVA